MKEKFEWKGLENIHPAVERKVSIHITTDYKWGRGWTLNEERAFVREVYPKLREAGYYIEQGSESFSCDTLHKATEAGFWNKRNKLSLYMHPMEYSGYASPEDIAIIKSTLEDCRTVYSVDEIRTSLVYDLSDSEYEELLARNITGIRDYFTHNNRPFDAFDFARNYRLPRIGDGPALCSGDTDIRFLSSAKIMLEELEREQSLKKETVRRSVEQIEVPFR